MKAFSPPNGCIAPEQVMSTAELQNITKLFGEGPAGHFHKGTYGYTHFVVEGPIIHQEVRKWCVLIHGLGTNLHVFDDLADALVSDGFTVLRYEFYNHGFSVGTVPVLRLNQEVMVTQVVELLNFVCDEDEKVSNSDSKRPRQ